MRPVAAPAPFRGFNRACLRPGVWLLVIGLGFSAGAMAQLIDANQYIERFMQYVRWPQEGQEQADWRICVLGGPDSAALHFQQLRARGRGFDVAVPADPASAVDCDVLDLTSLDDEAGQLAYLGAVRSLPVLTVGRGADFCRRGGHICLTRGAERQFDVNISALQTAGLHVNARLLGLGHAPLKDGA